MISCFTRALKVYAKAAVVTSLLVTVQASAQVSDSPVSTSNGNGMDTHLFRPAVDTKGFFSVNGTDVLSANSFSFGMYRDWGHTLMRTNNSDKPLGVDGSECEKVDDPNCAPDGLTQGGQGSKALVSDSFQGTLTASYGIANMAVVGVSVPITVLIGDATYAVGPDSSLYNSRQLDSQRVSNIIPHFKFRILRPTDFMGLAVIAQVGIPISSKKVSRELANDPQSIWYWPKVVLEKRFLSEGRIKVGAEVGYRGSNYGSPETQFGLDAFGEPQLKEGVLTAGNKLTYGVGFSYRATKKLDLVAEHYATYLTNDQTDAAQALSGEFLGGVKLFVEENSYLMAAGGSRAIFKGHEAADARVVLGFVYEPSIGDRDNDGLRDDVDECPDDPEDFDKFQDSDGCPDPDNDNDGILDRVDRCPDIPEDMDGDEDRDGCPEGDVRGDRDGDGIPDDEDQCPDNPEDRDGFEDEDGCPEEDNDKDGILDIEDQCPDDAEDFDQFEDEDGCPELDNDRDHIPDLEDECPLEPESYNGFEDEDGCPDQGKVIIDGSDIVILEKIRFASGSAKILDQSASILKAVAATLGGHPEFTIIEVAGHADERGSDQYNLDLTQRRAASVREALVAEGIADSRIVSQGYGEYCPVAKASNARAWEKNRRVDFKVVMTDEGKSKAPRGCRWARDNGIFPPPLPNN